MVRLPQRARHRKRSAAKSAVVPADPMKRLPSRKSRPCGQGRRLRCYPRPRQRRRLRLPRACLRSLPLHRSRSRPCFRRLMCRPEQRGLRSRPSALQQRRHHRPPRRWRSGRRQRRLRPLPHRQAVLPLSISRASAEAPAPARARLQAFRPRPRPRLWHRPLRRLQRRRLLRSPLRPRPRPLLLPVPRRFRSPGSRPRSRWQAGNLQPHRLSLLRRWRRPQRIRALYLRRQRLPRLLDPPISHRCSGVSSRLPRSVLPLSPLST